MIRESLGGSWVLSAPGMEQLTGNVPGSVYSILLANGKMDDPFYRDNELTALGLMENCYTFTKSFVAGGDLLSMPSVVLRCEGLDTVCTLTLNGRKLGEAVNMHRVWEYDVKDILVSGENTLAITFASPTRLIRELDAREHVGGSTDAMRGFSYVRKAHCMYGWDWGPRLPDAGIWREISLLGYESRLTDVTVFQRHEDGTVELSVEVWAENASGAELRVTTATPDGVVYIGEVVTIQNPMLWWPNGLGKQPLYTVRVELLKDGAVVDSVTKRIGLRTMTVKREKDEWGESFAQCVNGVPFFAMGADYIPEDNILSRVNPARTRKLLEQCVAANFNSVRVWGGGYYPSDDFYDSCDELGLVVWQDFMFACANYPLTYDFEDNISAEIRDNVRRLRHHASLGLWCGNNEMEMFQLTGEFESGDVTRAQYIRMFEHIIPHILREEDPVTFYWPASPSSGGSFVEPNDPNRGDVHYWDVWHGNKPFDEYRKFFFRYASEFGFQSFPSMKTVESFTLPEDRNIFSRVMEMHQRNGGANGKIMNYLSKTFLYPNSFDALLYASQLLQAEAIKYGVEHWRRNRGRCMGAVYWQLNDIWPVASWASIDYFGRWKALHYYAKRFFAPVMLSCEETGEFTNRQSVVDEPSPVVTAARLSVANESPDVFEGAVCWSLCDADSSLIDQGEIPVTVPAFTSLWLDPMEFEEIDYLASHLTFELRKGGEIVSGGSVLFTAPKHHRFLDPGLTCVLEGDTVVVKASAYAKSVEILSDSDAVFEDNYFDMDKGERRVRVLEGKPENLRVRSVFDIR